jgi:cytochrome P450
MLTDTSPTSSADLFTDEALRNPYPLYDELRAAGPVVWLDRLDVYAIPQYAEARAALREPETFCSGHGVTLNDVVNQATGGVAAISSDAPRHEQMRRVIRQPLMMDALRDLTPTLVAEAETLVDRLVRAGSFNAVTDLAQHLPLTVISKLVGIPEAGRQRMLNWATAAFDSMGPMNERTRAALPLSLEMLRYGNLEAVPPHLSANGWAQQVYDAADRGEIPHEMCPNAMSAYLAPSLDTTINGIGNAMLLLGQHPDQWQLLREDPSLVPNAVNEVLRLESPIQRFTRHVTQDTVVGDATIPEGSRVMILYGAANRDDRRWQNPTRFDVRRDRVAEHLAFGSGPHACVGSGLARLEMRVILEALVKRVARFEVDHPVWAINQFLRGLSSLEITVVES